MSTSSYQVRAKRNDNGGYTLAYGKGRKKIELRAIKRDDRGWQIANAPDDLMGRFDKISDLKDAFHAYATKVYGDVQQSVESNPLIDGSDPGGIIPPPPSRKKGPPKYAASRTDVSSDNHYLADPLNSDYYDKDSEGARRLTPIGGLVEVWDWARIHYPDPWSVMPFVNIAKILRRKYPDDKNFQPPTIVRRNK